MKQSTALDILKSGENVFLTGSAGSGKTYTLNQYIDYLKARRVSVAITASTGIAATHMNGMTIHTWSGIGIKDTLEPKDLKRMATRKYLKSHLEDAKVLIIDEISMLHGKQLDLVNQVLKYFKESDDGFGGIQIIVAGDFFQLPPVGKKEEHNRDKFAFMSQAWLDADFKVCYLTEQYRQKTDANQTDTPNLNDILNQMRTGTITQEAIHALINTKHNDLPDDITRLYTHNADVNHINQQHLQRLTTKSKTYTAKLDGNEKLIETLKKSVRAPENLELKQGAKVMFVKNNFEQGTYNGTLGEIVGFYEDTQKGILPEVRLNTGRRIIVDQDEWSIENEKGQAIATFTQFPLCYAWAITVHKSQGMTLESAEIDLSQTFEKGQGYVALSRLKDLAGLRLLGLNDTALMLDGLAMKADRRFLELSDDVENHFLTKDQDDLHKQQNGFILKMGGTISEYAIKQYQKRKQTKNTKHAKQTYSQSTLAETQALLAESLTIAEIASQRELAESTIINHIGKLKKQNPDLPIGHIKPDDALINEVAKGVLMVKEENDPNSFNTSGDLKIKPIYDCLRETVAYNDIRLALLFIE